MREGGEVVLREGVTTSGCEGGGDYWWVNEGMTNGGFNGGDDY